MCKQALWLAPAPPACTPNHQKHNAEQADGVNAYAASRGYGHQEAAS